MNDSTSKTVGSGSPDDTPLDLISDVLGPDGAARISDAEALVRAARTMHASLRLSELYEIVLKVIVGITGAESGVLLLHRPRTHHVINFKLWERGPGGTIDLPADSGHAFVRWLRERPEQSDGFTAPPDAIQAAINHAARQAVVSEAWYPLESRRRVFGAIGVRASAGKPGERISDLLVPLVEQATVALDNAILFRHAERQSLETRSLLEASRMLLTTEEMDDVLRAILNSLHKVLAYNAGGIFLVGSSGEVDRIVDRGYVTQPAVGTVPLERKARDGLVGWVATHGEPLIVGDVAQDKRYQCARAETQTEMVIPIFSGKRLVGILNLERDARNGFLEADMDLVSAYAQHAGVAIERARSRAVTLEQRHLKGELAVARRIQQTFLPKRSPDVPGFSIAGVNVPSEEVGGDYYDFLDVDDEKLGIAIADVAGKGIPAALIMAAFRASLIAEIRNHYTLHRIMQKVNHLLCEGNEESRFVTAIYGILDTKNRIFTFCNAGHNPGILRRADGTIELLHDGGTALGIFADAPFEERAFSLNPGDLILLYTDGVTEMIGRDGEMYEMQRLIETFNQNAHHSPQGIIDAIRQSLAEYADPQAPVDDLTLVVVRADA